MTVDDDSSELSSLSSLSPAPSDDELDEAGDDATSKSKQGILNYFPKLSEVPPKEPSPPPRKRSPSPPHEYVLADNPDIAVRARFLLFFLCCCFLALSLLLWKSFICVFLFSDRFGATPCMPAHSS